MSEMLSVRLPDELAEEIGDYVERSDMNKSDCVRSLLRQGLDCHETERLRRDLEKLNHDIESVKEEVSKPFWSDVF